MKIKSETRNVINFPWILLTRAYPKYRFQPIQCQSPPNFTVTELKILTQISFKLSLDLMLSNMICSKIGRNFSSNSESITIMFSLILCSLKNLFNFGISTLRKKQFLFIYLIKVMYIWRGWDSTRLRVLLKATTYFFLDFFQEKKTLNQSKIYYIA